MRDYFPKGTDLGIHTLEHLLAVQRELNNRPRMVIGDRTPHQLFTALLASESPPVLRRWVEFTPSPTIVRVGIEYDAVFASI